MECALAASLKRWGFSYVTATLAPFFLGRDAEDDEAELAGSKEPAALRKELQVFGADIRVLSQRPPET